MSIFDLNPQDQQALKERVQMFSIDGTKPLPPMGFAGLGEAGKALASTGARIDQSILGAGLAATATWDTVAGLATDNPYYHSATDWWAKHAVQGFGKDIVDTWTPDPTKMGASSQFLSSIFGIAGAVPFMAGAPELYLGSTAFSPALQLSDEGASTGAALAGGAISLGVNAAGFALPPAIGNNLSQRVLAGIGVNEALGVGHDVAMHTILDASGQPKLADQYQWDNWQQRGIDGVMGAVFGVLGDPAAQRAQNETLHKIGEQLAQDSAIRNAAKDALLTRLGGMSFGEHAAPGVPTSLGAMSRGQTALTSAIGSILRGDPVDVAGTIKPGDFVTVQPAPVAAKDWVTYRRSLESAGGTLVRSKTSSALGPDQFMPDTWRNVVAQAKPKWAEGLTDKELLKLRLDPEKSGEMATILTRANAAQLRVAGLPVNNRTLYAAWHFGAGKAIEFLNAAPETPASVLFSADVLKANPYLKGKTKEQVLANWDARAAGRKYTLDIAARNEGEDDKAYAKRVVDQLPEPTAEQLPDEPSRYFTDTDVAQSIPLDSLISSKSATENAKGGTNGLKRMAAAGEGALGKRAPIEVQDNGDGTFTDLDGNGTLTAARRAGFERLPARITRAKVPDNPELQARYEAAAEAYPAYRKAMTDIAARVGGRFVDPGLKSVSSVLEKISGEYGGDMSQVKDLLRGTIELPDDLDTGAALDALREKYGEPVKLWNNLNGPDAVRPDGYRGINAVFRVNGEPMEVQVNLPEMIAAKAQTHPFYEEWRGIRRRLAREDRAPTAEERARLAELDAKQAAIYEPAFAAAMRRMNSERLMGLASSRNIEPETRLPDGQVRASYSSSVTSRPSGSTPNSALSENFGSPDRWDFRGVGASAIRGTSKSSIPEIGQGEHFEQVVETSATSLAEANPGMPVVLEDGTKTTAGEALKQADDEIFQVAHDSRAFEAAALCAARNGDAI